MGKEVKRSVRLGVNGQVRQSMRQKHNRCRSFRLAAVLPIAYCCLNSSLFLTKSYPRNRGPTHQCQRPLAEKAEGLVSAFKRIWSLVTTLAPRPSPSGLQKPPSSMPGAIRDLRDVVLGVRK